LPQKNPRSHPNTSNATTHRCRLQSRHGHRYATPRCPGRRMPRRGPAAPRETPRRRRGPPGQDRRRGPDRAAPGTAGRRAAPGAGGPPEGRRGRDRARRGKGRPVGHARRPVPPQALAARLRPVRSARPARPRRAARARARRRLRVPRAPIGHLPARLPLPARLRARAALGSLQGRIPRVPARVRLPRDPDRDDRRGAQGGPPAAHRRGGAQEDGDPAHRAGGEPGDARPGVLQEGLPQGDAEGVRRAVGGRARELAGRRIRLYWTESAETSVYGSNANGEEIAIPY
ncbi:hypothetical protein DFJ74DRAFT_730882, partial [Hyaloraphidium curvatum]